MAPSTSHGFSNTPVTNGFDRVTNNESNGTSNSNETPNGIVDTEFLVVGAGPAGAALACFLGSYGEYQGSNPYETNQSYPLTGNSKRLQGYYDQFCPGNSQHAKGAYHQHGSNG